MRKGITDHLKIEGKELLEDIVNGETSFTMKAGLNFLTGACFGAVGKYSGEVGIPIAPIAMDLFFGTGLSPYAAFYGLGVAVNYMPEIYLLMENLPTFV